MQIKYLYRDFIKRNPKIMGNIMYFFTKIIHKTLRIKTVKHVSYCEDTAYLFAFWHGKQLLPVLELVKHNTKNMALVSQSLDGNILSVWLNRLGYKVLRGSSSNDNVRSLVTMLKSIKDGYSIGFGIDGPRGPIYKVKPGMTYLARKKEIKIVPLGSAFSSKWILKKAWDKYEIPKFFSKSVYYIGEPISIKDGDDLEISNKLIEDKIIFCETKAQELLQ